eukprot:13051723-Ditylum_brightwellii.AAC.2
MGVGRMLQKHIAQQHHRVGNVTPYMSTHVQQDADATVRVYLPIAGNMHNGEQAFAASHTDKENLSSAAQMSVRASWCSLLDSCLSHKYTDGTKDKGGSRAQETKESRSRRHQFSPGQPTQGTSKKTAGKKSLMHHEQISWTHQRRNTTRGYKTGHGRAMPNIPHTWKLQRSCMHVHAQLQN